MNESSSWQDLDSALGHDYILIREIPQPAGFSMFAARSKHDGSEVEIKTVAASIFSGTTIRDSDVASRRLQHPNIVPVTGSGTVIDIFYWISPAIEGRTLRARLSRGGRMELKDSLTILRDVSAALTHAHLHGVVHGGLSPDSVIISGGSGLVTALGIPEVFSALRRSGGTGAVPRPGAVESLRYSSPEASQGGAPDARSDVYAWGVIAYELLSGRHPFAGRATPREMMAAHSDEEPQPLTSGPTSVPGGVTRLVMRTLSKDPSKRPESAREILAVMTKEMLVPPPAPAAGSGQKAVMAMVVLLVVLLAVVAWLGMSSP